MSVAIIISIISLIFDGVLTNFLPYLNGDLTLFTPMFSVVSIFLLYPLLLNDNKKYLLYTFIYGIIYDLLYTNLFLYDAFIFLFLGFFTLKIYKNFKVTKIKVLIYLSLSIIIYESLFAGSVLILNLVPITIEKLIYKISHSLIINLIYGEILYIIIDLLPTRYHSKKINSYKKIIK